MDEKRGSIKKAVPKWILKKEQRCFGLPAIYLS